MVYEARTDRERLDRMNVLLILIRISYVIDTH
jgi:hypothetical protein